MKELYSEGIANHADPESCGCGSNSMTEALTGTKKGGVKLRVSSLSGTRIDRRSVFDLYWPHDWQRICSDRGTCQPRLPSGTDLESPSRPHYGHVPDWAVFTASESTFVSMRYLIRCRNPCSLSKVLVQRLCLLNGLLLQANLSCPHNSMKGVTDEPFSKIITDDMALPIMCSLT